MIKQKTIYSTGLSLILLLLISPYTFGRQGTATDREENKPAVTYITGRLQTGNPQDTMVLDILKEFAGSAKTFAVDTTLVQIMDNGSFKFTPPALDRPVYFNLQTRFIKGIPYSDWRNHLLESYMLMPGDSIHIEYLEADKRVAFSGQGAARFNWLYETRRQVYQKAASLPEAGVHNNPEQYLANSDTILNLTLSRLELLAKEVPANIYRIMKADEIGLYMGNTHMNLSLLDLGAAYKDSAITRRTIDAYRSKLYERVADTSSAQLLAASRFYATYLLNKARAKYKYQRHVGMPHPADFFTALKGLRYPGILKEKMIMAYLYERIAGSALSDQMVSDALAMVNTPRYRHMLLEMKETHGTGQLVADHYVFKDKLDNPVRLSDFKGKVIFIDMWFTGCAGCIAIAKALPEVEREFHGNPNVVFISLSIDKDKAKWMRSIDDSIKPSEGAKKAPYTHYTTADTKYFYTGGSGADHPFISKYNPTATFPNLLLLDKGGRIFTSDVPRPLTQQGKEKLVSLIKEALNQD